jgi:hypothetical protein
MTTSFQDIWFLTAVLCAVTYAQVRITLMEAGGEDVPLHGWLTNIALVSILLLIAVVIVYGWKVSMLKALLLVPAALLGGGIIGGLFAGVGLLRLMAYVGLVLGPLNGIMALSVLGVF